MKSARVKEAGEFGGRRGKRELSAPLPGNRPYKKAGGTGLVPKGGIGCVNCGFCVEQYPAQTIRPGDPRETDSGACISCMRCVVRCPQGARKVNGALVSAQTPGRIPSPAGLRYPL